MRWHYNHVGFYMLGMFDDFKPWVAKAYMHVNFVMPIVRQSLTQSLPHLKSAYFAFAWAKRHFGYARVAVV
jgi:hypothetical protein